MFFYIFFEVSCIQAPLTKMPFLAQICVSFVYRVQLKINTLRSIFLLIYSLHIHCTFCFNSSIVFRMS